MVRKSCLNFISPIHYQSRTRSFLARLFFAFQYEHRNEYLIERNELLMLSLFYSPNFFTFSVSGYRSIAPRVCQFRSENHCLKLHLGSLSRNRFLRSFDRRIPTDKTLYVYRPMHSARCRKRQKIKNRRIKTNEKSSLQHFQIQ